MGWKYKIDVNVNSGPYEGGYGHRFFSHFVETTS